MHHQFGVAEKGWVAAGCEAFAGVPVRSHCQVRRGAGRGTYSQTTGLAICYFGDETSITSGLDPEPTDFKQSRGRCCVGMMHRLGHSVEPMSRRGPTWSQVRPQEGRDVCNTFQKCFHQGRSGCVRGRGHSVDVQDLRVTSVPRENVYYIRGVVSQW